MNLRYLQLSVLAVALTGCADFSTKPTEALDESTGLTIASMESPIELVQEAMTGPPSTDRRPSFVYLGPVEWNRMGTITHGLWVHVAPGNDQRLGDIHASGAVSIALDDGNLDLTIMNPPSVGREPYKAVASWGQTAYFAMSPADLTRLAASAKLKVGVRGDAGTAVMFVPTHDTHVTLTRYALSRGVIVD